MEEAAIGVSGLKVQLTIVWHSAVVLECVKTSGAVLEGLGHLLHKHREFGIPMLNVKRGLSDFICLPLWQHAKLLSIIGVHIPPPNLTAHMKLAL